MAAPLEIPQGTTRTIVAGGITDAAGDPIPAGWTVRAVARRSASDAAVLAAWSSSPLAGEGTAEHTGPEVRLTITPAMSRAWTWGIAQLDCHITEPISPFREELVIDRVLINQRTTVSTP